MPGPIRNYMDRVNPTAIAPGEGRLGGPRSADLHTAWNRIARTLGVTAPANLDRCRTFRNRFIDAVQ